MPNLSPFNIHLGKYLNEVTDGKSPLPLPFTKEILLLETYIAGTFHLENPDPETLSKTLRKNDRLKLIREQENLYDEFAIRVETERGEKVGYVPKKNNEVIARLMDCGKLIYATIDEFNFVYERLSIEISIFMTD
ncbi:MAG: HIRAN domain-containing protein [Chloroherpetonaceae bacterium]|nr:HIRAN domain-containing protein [Chloroherpetonaceae bacterium]